MFYLLPVEGDTGKVFWAFSKSYYENIHVYFQQLLTSMFYFILKGQKYLFDDILWGV